MINTLSRQASLPLAQTALDESTAGRTQQLLLCCSRRALTAADRARALALIEGGVSWSLLAEEAQVNGLAPLIRHNLRGLEVSSQIPGPIWQRFEETYYSTLGDNLLLETELLAVAACLQARDVSFLILKGMVLGQLLYPDPALRPSTDLDILIHDAQIPQARRALEELGYALQPGRRLDFQLTRSYDLPYLRTTTSGQPVLLELHWNLAEDDLFDLDAMTLWQRSRPFAWRDLALRSLSLEDVLLHLTIHIRKHRYVGLRWLVDVSEMLRTYGERLDWTYLVAAAQRCGAATLVYTTLDLAQNLMDVTVPARVLQALRPHAARRLLLRPFVNAANVTRVVPENSAEWSWLGLGQVLLLDRVSTMAVDLGHRLLPPIEIFPDQQARPRGLLSDTQFYVARFLTIGGRMGRSMSRRGQTALRRLWNRVTRVGRQEIP